MSSSNDTSGPSPGGGIVDILGDQIVISGYTILTALGLVLAYTITITKFRLWHTNPILEKIPQLVNNPIAHILSIGVSLVAVIPYRNDLYIIWLVILAIIFDNVQALSSFSLLEKGADRLSREHVYLYNCVVIGAVIIRSDRNSVYFHPLLALWSLLILKFIERLINYKVADRAYGIKNTDLVTDYMEIEHTLSDETDPQSMKGYKYLVVGEEKTQCKVQHPLYTLDFDHSKGEVVTLERVWECNTGLLDPTIDKDGRIKDVCLSFALFKLIRRRFFGYRAGESKESKTKQLVFNGLLSRDKEEVYRVIKMEMGFLRDFFYTRYPVAFAIGFPLLSIVILIAMCAISISISAKAFHEHKHPGNMDYLIVKKRNVDYRITNGLLIIIIVTEIFEVFSYVFSDWMKLTTICTHVNSKIKVTIPVIDQMLSLLIKLRFNISLKNTIGQYSLLKSYNKGECKRVTTNFVYHSTCAMVGTKIVRGLKADKEIILSEEVKAAIFDALKTSDGNFTDRLASLKRNGIAEKDLSWLDSIKTRPILTIMVWHIATSLCEIRPILKQPIIEDTNCSAMGFTKCFPSQKKETPDEQAIKAHHLVASNLSKYCAYLVVFAPELLPTTINSAKRTFDQIVLETSEFFEKANGPKAQYEEAMNTMMEAEEKGDKVIDMGVKLGQYLVEKITDDVKRWKVMADVWSELILYVAPSGKSDGHLKKLASGGEFITHLWALLYHAGIDEFKP